MRKIVAALVLIAIAAGCAQVQIGGVNQDTRDRTECRPAATQPG